MANIFFSMGTTVRFFLFITGIFCVTSSIYAQNRRTNNNNKPPVNQPDTGKKGSLIIVGAKDTNINHTDQYLTLKQCIDYALIHQPALNRSLININVTKETNAVNLAAWLPQVNATGSLVHYLTTSSNGVAVTSSGSTTGTTTTGTTTGSSTRSSAANSFVPQLAVSQAIFSPSLLYTSRSAPLFVKQAQEITDSTKIFLISAISKSFYNVLLNLEQINVLKEDTARLGQNVRDTYHQYIGGIVDETNYEEATITLNNSMAQLKQANENVVPQFAILKQLMGFPPEQRFNVSFDTLQMMQGIHIDTAQQLRYESRIEYQQLNTQKGLQNELLHFYRSAYLPTVSAFFNYSLQYQNNNFPNLLSSSYPNSIVGLSFSIPIFTGFARTHSIQRAKLQSQLLNWDEVELKSQIYTEYSSALASYKGNLYNLQLLEKNVALAKRAYFVINLQYKQGIVAYLNVITAESNLITSEISYLNALFQVLSSKIDLQKAMGSISY
ncbi:MAG: oprM 3 [Mucilaginibacter sp.]|nr:oprM 3 [Mucilaginibacter sp.]